MQFDLWLIYENMLRSRLFEEAVALASIPAFQLLY
jgi:hypothetical protein